MSAKFVTKRGDTNPSIRSWLSDRNDEDIDFTGASVVLCYQQIMDDGTFGTAVRRAASILQFDAKKALVEYQFISADTASSGTFRAEWEVTLLGGNIETFPKGGYFSIVVVDDVR